MLSLGSASPGRGSSSHSSEAPGTQSIRAEKIKTTADTFPTSAPTTGSPVLPVCAATPSAGDEGQGCLSSLPDPKKPGIPDPSCRLSLSPLLRLHGSLTAACVARRPLVAPLGLPPALALKIHPLWVLLPSSPSPLRQEHFLMVQSLVPFSGVRLRPHYEPHLVFLLLIKGLEVPPGLGV